MAQHKTVFRIKLFICTYEFSISFVKSKYFEDFQANLQLLQCESEDRLKPTIHAELCAKKTKVPNIYY